MVGGLGKCLRAEITQSQPVLDGQSREKCFSKPQNPTNALDALFGESTECLKSLTHTINCCKLQNAKDESHDR